MNDTTESPQPLLTQVEARVLGCLMEKQRSTPDQYPLTLNGLVTACNQKTSRSPVMRLEVGEVGHTVNLLRDRALVHASFSGRTERYDHRMTGHFKLDRQQQALLCVLMLRGPQTLGELRTNAARLADFADLGAVGDTLRALEEREPPLVVELPRLSGMREERYAHLLCGEPEQELPASAAAPATRRGSETDQRIERLEAEVASLRIELDALKQTIGQ